MSTLIKATLVLVAASVLGACAQQEEEPVEVVVIEEEPVYTKY